MDELRPAERAGRWYPGTAGDCDRFFEDVKVTDRPLPPQRVGAIVPHAGWVYSGAVAFEALREVRDATPDAELVVVFGGHLGPRDQPRVLIDGAWETPYGPMEVAKDIAEDLSMAIMAEPETPDEYYDDNAVEVLMPMVKKLWPEAKVVTVGVPPTPDATKIGAEVIDAAKRRGISKIVLVGSTDLTHYGPNYAFSPKGRGWSGLEWVKRENDPQVIEKMEALDPGKVLWVAQRQRNACCPGAAAACIAAAKKLGAEKAVTTEYTTSFDVRPSEPEPTSFVGYVGVVLGR